MKLAICIKTKYDTMAIVLSMLALFISNETIVVAEDVTPTVEVLSRIKALEKRVEAIKLEINDLKSQRSYVDGQLTESTILGTWLFQKSTIKCQLVFKPNHRFQIITSDSSQGIINASGQGEWKIKGDQVIVEYSYDGPQIVVPPTTLILSLALEQPDTLIAYGIAYQKQPAMAPSPSIAGVTLADAKISLELSEISDYQKPRISVPLEPGTEGIDWSNIPSGFELIGMTVRAKSGAEEHLKPGDAVSVLSYPSKQSKENKMLVVVVPEAKLFTILTPVDKTNLRIAILLIPKGMEHSFHGVNRRELHLVRQLVTNNTAPAHQD